VKRNLSRRRGFTAAVALACLLAMTIVLSATAATTKHRDNVTITWMTFETANLPAPYWDDIVTRFEAKNPGINVKRIVTPTLDRDGYAKQLLASGQFPDVLQSITVQDFASQGLLYAWTPAERADWHILFPKSEELNGKQYTIPQNSQLIPLMYYNKAAFAKVHAKPPKTWAQFLAVCAKLKAAGTTPILLGGSKDTWTSWIFLGGIFSADVLGKDPNWILHRKQNKVHFTDPLVQHAFNKWAALAKAGYINKDALSLDYPGMQQAFLDGKAAMYPMGSWAASKSAVGASSFGTGVFRVPTDNGAAVQAVITGGGIYVNAKSAHLDAAKKLAEFWSLDPKANATLATNDAGLIAVRGFQQPTGLTGTFYQTAATFSQKSTKKNPIKTVDVMFFNAGDRGSLAGMDGFYATAAQNILLGKSVMSQLKFLDQQWNKAAAAGH
jgi:ABC-type glycerol-3-phosphate transport system substrate-binding protein